MILIQMFLRLDSLNNKLDQLFKDKNELELKFKDFDTILSSKLGLMSTNTSNDKKSIHSDLLESSNKFSRSLTSLNNITIEMDVSIKPLKSDHDSNDKIKIIYPKTKIYRGFVPSNKKSWTIEYKNYLPVKYTSKDVLSNTNADIDFLSIKYYLEINRKSPSPS